MEIFQVFLSKKLQRILKSQSHMPCIPWRTRYKVPSFKLWHMSLLIAWSHLSKTPINKDHSQPYEGIRKHWKVLKLCQNQAPKPPRTSRTKNSHKALHCIAYIKFRERSLRMQIMLSKSWWWVGLKPFRVLISLRRNKIIEGKNY